MCSASQIAFLIWFNDDETEVFVQCTNDSGVCAAVKTDNGLESKWTDEEDNGMDTIGLQSGAVAGRITKRAVLGQVFVCSGCCCGRTDKGKPEIPLDWLKQSWKERKLLKSVQLTITGFLGPCDILNVVGISTEDGQRWFGGITTAAPYEVLVEWAETTRQLGEAAPIPASLLEYEFQRFS